MPFLILDSGHAEYVAGKRSGNFLEWVFNNSMQYKLKKRAEDHKISVFLTNPSPAKKDEIGLSKRVSLANSYYINTAKRKNCLFISIHGNAYGSESARGTETFVASNASTTSKNFAKDVNNEIVKVFKSKDAGAKDRGMKVQNYAVLKCLSPCALIEYGFYSNSKDRAIMEKYQDELTEATMKSICKTLGVTYKPLTSNPTPPPTNSGGTTYFRVIAASYLDRNEANENVARVKSLGWKDAFLVAFEKDGKSYLRVVVKSTPDRKEADAELTKLKKHYSSAFLGTFVK